MNELQSFIVPIFTCVFVAAFSYCVGRAVGKKLQKVDDNDGYPDDYPYGEGGIPVLDIDKRIWMLKGIIQEEISGYYAGGTLIVDVLGFPYMFQIGDGDTYEESYLIAIIYLKYKSKDSYFWLAAMKTKHEYEYHHQHEEVEDATDSKEDNL